MDDSLKSLYMYKGGITVMQDLRESLTGNLSKKNRNKEEVENAFTTRDTMNTE